MTPDDLDGIYRGYLACLNARDWTRLGDFVAADVRHNGRTLGLDGYRAMLEDDYAAIPDLRFVADRIVSRPPHLAARLRFDCTPVGDFLGLTVDGRRVRFFEHAFYTVDDGRIAVVESVIDRAAIETQIRTA